MREKVAESLKLIGAMVLMAVVFGLLHDLFSASVCVEYFTVYHPHLIDSQNWLVQALFWGVFATWWVGLFGGAWLAICTQMGRRNPAPTKETTVLISKCAATVLVLAPIVWFSIYRFGMNVIQSPDFKGQTTEADVRVFSSGVMHAVSYALAGLCFLFVGIRQLWRRYRNV